MGSHLVAVDTTDASPPRVCIKPRRSAPTQPAPLFPYRFVLAAFPSSLRWPPSPDPPSLSPGQSRPVKVTRSALSFARPVKVTRSALSFARPVKAVNASSLSFSSARKGNGFLRLQPVPMRFSVCCAAKKDTVDKVCEIVKKQLAVPEGTEVCGASKFSDLGADSLDTVEIVMGLEEEFKISVEESSAQSIATVEDAAELIDKLVAEKSS